MVLGLIALGHAVPGLALAAGLPAPAAAAWPFVAASTAIHWAYYGFLGRAYRAGDLSLVYPVARGAAPLFVALGALLVAGETLPLPAWAGIATVSAGIFLIARPSRLARQGRGGLAAALATSVAVAAYSVVDGIGVRASGQPLAYVAWLFAAEALFAGWVLGSRRRRLSSLGGGTVLLGLAGGLVSAATYGLVLHAKTLAPIAMVSAMRETSVLFAALLGVVLFREGPAGRRLGAAGVVAAGVVLIALA